MKRDYSYLKKFIMVQKRLAKDQPRRWYYIYWAIRATGKGFDARIEAWTDPESKNPTQAWKLFEKALKLKHKKDYLTSIAPALIIPDEYKEIFKFYYK
jgi:hypothetical protein